MSVVVDDAVGRAQAALAEVGYGYAPVRWDRGRQCLVTAGYVPDRIAWRAFAISDPDHTDCWPCWSEQVPGCPHHPLEERWPEVTR